VSFLRRPDTEQAGVVVGGERYPHGAPEVVRELLSSRSVVCDRFEAPNGLLGPRRIRTGETINPSSKPSTRWPSSALRQSLMTRHIELERTRILEGEAGVTHMHYRVQR
jgi:hypothetical protein